MTADIVKIETSYLDVEGLSITLYVYEESSLFGSQLRISDGGYVTEDLALAEGRGELTRSELSDVKTQLKGTDVRLDKRDASLYMKTKFEDYDVDVVRLCETIQRLQQ
ncbi:DUF1828 domain-containing protein [Weissella cibaria]|uniref:DUF1828 domain-containing protein n=1 Tax=Weissella cibaria TaxID=137591 RepID=UPI0015E8542E|nr:DUF1828 domain-containing protein [Weissella cibaria]QMU87956.1 DUF1828 domain-containing protein [Weissella cibaria]